MFPFVGQFVDQRLPGHGLIGDSRSMKVRVRTKEEDTTFREEHPVEDLKDDVHQILERGVLEPYHVSADHGAPPPVGSARPEFSAIGYNRHKNSRGGDLTRSY
jgi:hypothetical protein